MFRVTHLFRAVGALPVKGFYVSLLLQYSQRLPDCMSAHGVALRVLVFRKELLPRQNLSGKYFSFDLFH